MKMTNGTKAGFNQENRILRNACFMIWQHLVNQKDEIGNQHIFLHSDLDNSHPFGLSYFIFLVLLSFVEERITIIGGRYPGFFDGARAYPTQKIDHGTCFVIGA